MSSMKYETLSHEELKSLLQYNPCTGEFKWKLSCGRVKSGGTAGTISFKGYCMIMIRGKLFPAHRLAWLYMNGAWPADQIDHINRIRSDNRICNLRLATGSQNNQNQALSKRNTSGYRGVSFDKNSKKWIARIYINSEKKYLGLFASKEDAHSAYIEAAKQVHTRNPLCEEMK